MVSVSLGISANSSSEINLEILLFLSATTTTFSCRFEQRLRRIGHGLFHSAVVDALRFVLREHGQC